MNNLFLKFIEGGVTHYAKILRLEFNKERALFMEDRNHWIQTYVAFEVNGNPESDERYDKAKVYDVLPATPVANNYIRHAVFNNGFGRLSQVLILLKK
jgi:hypothetical protein